MTIFAFAGSEDATEMPWAAHWDGSTTFPLPSCTVQLTLAAFCAFTTKEVEVPTSMFSLNGCFVILYSPATFAVGIGAWGAIGVRGSGVKTGACVGVVGSTTGSTGAGVGLTTGV